MAFGKTGSLRLTLKGNGEAGLTDGRQSLYKGTWSERNGEVRFSTDPGVTRYGSRYIKPMKVQGGRLIPIIKGGTVSRWRFKRV